MWKLLKIAFFIICIPLLYVFGMIAYAYFTQYKPNKIEIIYENKNAKAIEQRAFTMLNWNIGYAGLGKESDFFYDGGKMVHVPEQLVIKNIEGIKEELYKQNVDFYTIQEIDRYAKRSVYTDQFRMLYEILPQHFHFFATNYKVNFVPVPYTNPMGKVYAGLGFFSRFEPIKVYRYQFDGKFEFPTYLFMLNRCMIVSEFLLKNGKKLIVINAHFSAYDESGKVKNAEMQDFKKIIQAYEKNGNYVIVGADWNQFPPGFQPNKFIKNAKNADRTSIISNDFLPPSWSWKYDTTVATNRQLLTSFDKKNTNTCIIDFYLRSKNIQVDNVITHDLQFEFSDHQPTLLKMILNE